MLSGPVQAEEMPAGNHRDDVDAATLAGGTRLGSSPERPRGALGRSARAPPVPNEDGPPAEHQVRPAPARSHPRTWRRSEAFPEPPGASASCSLRTCRADAPYVVSRRAGTGTRRRPTGSAARRNPSSACATRSPGERTPNTLRICPIMRHGFPARRPASQPHVPPLRQPRHRAPSASQRVAEAGDTAHGASRLPVPRLRQALLQSPEPTAAGRRPPGRRSLD